MYSTAEFFHDDNPPTSQLQLSAQVTVMHVFEYSAIRFSVDIEVSYIFWGFDYFPHLMYVWCLKLHHDSIYAYMTTIDEDCSQYVDHKMDL